ncbi:hypothetical protein AB1N83_010684 [Pleurotus pulmonarius]
MNDVDCNIDVRWSHKFASNRRRPPNTSFITPLTTPMKFRTVSVSPSVVDVDDETDNTVSLDTHHCCPRVSHDTLAPSTPGPNPTHSCYCQRDKRVASPTAHSTGK